MAKLRLKRFLSFSVWLSLAEKSAVFRGTAVVDLVILDAPGRLGSGM